MRRKVALNYLDQPIYSRVDVAAAAQTNIQFFSTGMGDLQYTNLSKANELPLSQNFICTTLRLYVHSRYTDGTTPTPFNDIAGFQLGHVEMVADGAASQFNTLGFDAPGGGGIGGLVAEGAAATQLALANGSTSRSQVRTFTVRVPIPKGRTFAVNVKFNSAWTPAGIIPIVAVLDGYLTRRAL